MASFSLQKLLGFDRTCTDQKCKISTIPRRLIITNTYSYFGHEKEWPNKKSAGSGVEVNRDA